MLYNTSAIGHLENEFYAKAAASESVVIDGIDLGKGVRPDSIGAVSTADRLVFALVVASSVVVTLLETFKSAEHSLDFDFPSTLGFVLHVELLLMDSHT